MTKKDGLDECWCCGGLHDSFKALCPACDDAGCKHFGGECQSDHKPVVPDGGRAKDTTPTRYEPEDIDIVVDGGMPCIDLPGGKIRLRCFMEHERFPGESIEGDDLEVRRQMLPDGTVWTVETEGEHLLNLTIEPELMEE